MRRRHRDLLPTLSHYWPHITGDTIADIPPAELAVFITAARLVPPVGGAVQYVQKGDD